MQRACPGYFLVVRDLTRLWIGSYLGLGLGLGIGATLGSALVSPLFWLACSVAGLIGGALVSVAASRVPPPQTRT